MAAPSWVSRIFEPWGRIGPSIYLALSYGVRGAFSWIRAKIGLDADPAEEQARKYEETVVDLLDIDQMMAAAEEILPPADERFEAVPDATDRQRTLEVAKFTARRIVRNHRARKSDDPAAKAMRGQHAKHHGCVSARFVVDDDIPREFAKGIFEPGATYDAVLRFSNADERSRSDKKGDGRGLAIKIRLPPETGERPDEQDFLLANNPVFFVDNAAEYTRFTLARDKSGWRLAWDIFRFFVPFRLRKLSILIKLRRSRIANPLDASYSSMSPFLLDENLVRYIVGPAKLGGHASPHGAPSGEAPDYLRERLAEILGSTESGAPVVLEFSVRVRGNPNPMDGERASRPWRRRSDRLIRLARIEIPRQDFDGPNALLRCENLVFNPWNFLPEHRPVGGINRMRLLTYRVAAETRHRLNMVRPKQH